MGTKENYALVLGSTINALSCIRSLGRREIKVVGLDRAKKKSGATYSKYLVEFIGVDPEASEEVFLEEILKIGEKYPKPIFLFPTNDFFVLLVSKYRDRLRDQFRFALAEHQILTDMVDKQTLYENAERLEVPCPKTFTPKSLDELMSKIDDVQFPCFLKPSLGHLFRKRYKNVKLLKIENKEELIEKYKEIHALDLEVMVQEIIPGGDDTIFGIEIFMDKKGVALGACTKQKLRQFPIGTGDGSLQITVDKPELQEYSVKFLKGLGYEGPACIEFRYDHRDGKHKLIEINARTISGQQMIADAGFDLPYLAYRYSKGESVEPLKGYKAGVKWISFEWDFEAFIEARRMGILTIGGWLRSLQGINSRAYFAWDDLRPYFVQLGKFINRLWTGVTKKAA